MENKLKDNTRNEIRDVTAAAGTYRMLFYMCIFAVLIESVKNGRRP